MRSWITALVEAVVLDNLEDSQEEEEDDNPPRPILIDRLCYGLAHSSLLLVTWSRVRCGAGGGPVRGRAPGPKDGAFRIRY
jgi:hypothetical protein